MLWRTTAKRDNKPARRWFFPLFVFVLGRRAVTTRQSSLIFCIRATRVRDGFIVVITHIVGRIWLVADRTGGGGGCASCWSLL